MALYRNKLIMAVILASLCQLFLLTCTETEYIVIDNKIELTGTVLAFYCGNQTWGRDSRYSVNTGKPALVSLVSESGKVQSTTTNDSSTFSMFLDSGMYNVIVETGHSFPSTITGLVIAKDTALELRVSYSWLDDDTVWVGFYYPHASDSLGIDAEVSHIKRLNYLMGGDFIEVFDSRQVEIYDYRPFISASVEYAMPIVQGEFIYDIVEKSNILLETPELGFPLETNTWASFYICPYD